jgi:hypothetical protein
MQDLSALTPPLLMCAAVLFAIGAFLRHEMGRKRSGDPDERDDIPAAGQISGHAAVSNRQVSANSSADDREA